MKKQKKTIKKKKWENSILMEIERITLDCHLNSISQEEARNEIWSLFCQIIQRFIEETTKELREELAELEHKQWESWSKYTADQLIYKRVKPEELLEKWHKNWNPYSELTEEEKDKDRIWADKVLKKLNQTQTKWLKENLK